jgi:lysozyme
MRFGAKIHFPRSNNSMAPNFCSLVAFLTVTSLTVAADIDRDKLRSQLVKHEGKKTKVYMDTEGIPTIGVGFNLNRADAKKKIEGLGLTYDKVKAGTQELTDKQILTLLDSDIDAAIINCKSVFPTFTEISDVRQRVLVDMMFNLGKTRFTKFEKMIARINNSDFASAADEMKKSEWYNQVKERGNTLERMMRGDKD